MLPLEPKNIAKKKNKETDLNENPIGQVLQKIQEIFSVEPTFAKKTLLPENSAGAEMCAPQKICIKYKFA